MNSNSVDYSKFIGVDLYNIKRVLARPGNIGYDAGLHYYYLFSDAEVKLFNKSEPMAIVNINPDPDLSIVAFCCRRWYDNIETLDKPPGDGYELIILSFFEAAYGGNEEDYTQ